MGTKGLVTISIALVAVALAVSCTNLAKDGDEVFTATQATASQAPNTSVPGYYGGVVPWDQDDPQLVPVLVQPQQEASLGEGKMTLSLAAIPFTVPADHGTARGTSDLAQGAEFYSAKRVAESEVQGYTFAPAEGDPAYACYELKAPLDTPFTVGIAWYSLPEDMDGYFVGIGDPAMQTWHWYSGLNDGVLTFDPTNWRTPGEIGESAYVCVALQDGKPADFWQLKWGVTEMRGTGLVYQDDPATSAPAKDFSKSASTALPSLHSLKGYMPPMSDQGGMGSCTAFAINDAAFNGLLALMYEEYGWDVQDDANRTSPMWCYIKSGFPPYGDWTPPCGSAGRYINQGFDVLEGLGTATQETVPYYTTFNCSNEFPAKAAIEAPMLKIDEWYPIGGGKNFIVKNIKTSLAENNRPVVIAMYGLETAFLSYNGGVYHYMGTPGNGGGHAMCIVGYDDTIEAFEVRNSWGIHWGLDGYWWCGYDAVKDLYAEGSRFKAYSMSASFNQDVPTYFFGAAPVYDEVEPNDGLEAAQALPQFDFYNFTGRLGGEGDPADCFSFDFKKGDLSEFSLLYDSSNAVLSLELYDEEGTLIAESQAGEGAEEIAGYWGAKGTAVLKVVHTGGQTDYNLTGIVKHPPPPPKNVKASKGKHDDRIYVTWNMVSESAYYVYRSEGPDGPFELVASINENRYNDYETLLLRDYWYQIQAVNVEAAGIPSEPAAGYRAAPAPTGVTAGDGEFEHHVIVQWDQMELAPSFVVKRSSFPKGPFDAIGYSEVESFEDASVEPGMTYYYVVHAAGGDREGPASQADGGSLLAGPLEQGQVAEDAPSGDDEELEPGAGNQAQSGNVEVTGDDEGRHVVNGRHVGSQG